MSYVRIPQNSWKFNCGRKGGIPLKKAEKVFFQVKSLKIEYGLVKKQNDENITSFRNAVTDYAQANGLPFICRDLPSELRIAFR